MLCALCLLRACGEKAEHFIPLLSRIKAVRGRLEWVCRLKNNANIFVDYAHTPDALERLLKDLRTHTQNKLHVIVGAGGDRDKEQAKKIGQICAKYADEITITDDNPRNEDPAEIRLAVMAGSPNAQNIASRKAAIHSAIDALQSGDVLVVAGKGHEQGQEQGGKILPFDDKMSLPTMWHNKKRGKRHDAHLVAPSSTKRNRRENLGRGKQLALPLTQDGLKKGNLFIAIIGENLDGHDFLQSAPDKGLPQPWSVVNGMQKTGMMPRRLTYPYWWLLIR